MSTHNPAPDAVRTQPPHRFPGVWLGLVVLCACAGVLLRLVQLTTVPGLNADEAYHGALAAAWWRGQEVSWQTPNGNVINPFNFVPQLVLMWLFPPALWMTKVPIVVANFVFLCGGFWFVHRHVGRVYAASFVVLASSSPLIVIYTRLGWDPGFIVPVALALFASVWRGELRLAVLFSSMGLLCHPTFVFVLPCALALWLGQRPSSVAALVRCLRRRAWWLAIGLVALLVAILSSQVVRALLVGDALHWSMPALWWGYPMLWLNLLSGTSSLLYVTGEAWRFADLLHLLDACAVLWGVAVALHRRDVPALALLIGIFTSLAVFFVRAGPLELTPHSARYGLWLAVPVLWLLVLTLTPSRMGRALMVLCAVVNVYALLDGYFAPLRRGRCGHDTFCVAEGADLMTRTFAVAAAAQQTCDAPLTLAAEDFWLEVPLTMLAAKTPGLTVVRGKVDAQATTDGHIVVRHATSTSGEGDVIVRGIDGRARIEVVLPRCAAPAK